MVQWRACGWRLSWRGFCFCGASGVSSHVCQRPLAFILAALTATHTQATMLVLKAPSLPCGLCSLRRAQSPLSPVHRRGRHHGHLCTSDIAAGVRRTARLPGQQPQRVSDQWWGCCLVVSVCTFSQHVVMLRPCLFKPACRAVQEIHFRVRVSYCCVSSIRTSPHTVRLSFQLPMVPARPDGTPACSCCSTLSTAGLCLSRK
jgi:hypothetical protein